MPSVGSFFPDLSPPCHSLKRWVFGVWAFLVLPVHFALFWFLAGSGAAAAHRLHEHLELVDGLLPLLCAFDCVFLVMLAHDLNRTLRVSLGKSLLVLLGIVWTLGI